MRTALAAAPLALLSLSACVPSQTETVSWQEVVAPIAAEQAANRKPETEIDRQVKAKLKCLSDPICRAASDRQDEEFAINLIRRDAQRQAEYEIAIERQIAEAQRRAMERANRPQTPAKTQPSFKQI
jgi:hypothetical protein